METKTCKICGTKLDQCDCLNAVTDVMALLMKVDSRVSRQEVASEHDSNSSQASIDKLTFILLSPVKREDLVRTCDEIGIQHQIKTLKDKKWYLIIGSESQGCFASLGHPENPEVRKFITRPNAFATFYEYSHFLTQFIPSEVLHEAKLQRLDLAVDYRIPYKSTLTGFDVLFKRQRDEFFDQKSTGLLVGRGSSKVQLYDKQTQSKLRKPLSRLELQLGQDKLPCSRFGELMDALLAPDFQPFKHVKLNDVTFVDSGLLSKNQQRMFFELKVLVEHDGYYAARRKLNVNGNFKRDYGHMVELSPWPNQPDLVLTSSMKAFLGS